MIIKGKVYKFGNDVNTDEIIPAKYLNMSVPEELGRHCMEGIDETFAGKVSAGDVIVAGKNFGCGSSREHAPWSIKGCGISCVVAESFARIFYRAAINQGLVLIECPEAVRAYTDGDDVSLNIEGGTVTINDQQYHFPPLPAEIVAIRNAGGLLPFTREKLEKKRGLHAKKE